MFKKTTLKILAKVAIGISLLSAILTLIAVLMENGKIIAFLPILSWIIFAYASYCAMKLTDLDVYDEDLKSIGWSIYGLFLLFFVYLLIGISISPIIALFIAIRLHLQKRGLQNWAENNDQV